MMGWLSVAIVAVWAGSESVLVPAIAGAARVIAPDVSPEITTELIIYSFCLF